MRRPLPRGRRRPREADRRVLSRTRLIVSRRSRRLERRGPIALRTAASGRRRGATMRQGHPPCVVHEIRYKHIFMSTRSWRSADDRLRRPARQPAGGGRGDAAEADRPARRSRADGQRTRRHPRPVAAARFAPSEAAGRSGPRRAPARGRLGVLPPRRLGRRAGARADRPRRPGRSDASPPIARGWRRRARRGASRRRPISPSAPPTGTPSARCTPPESRVEAAIMALVGDRPIRGLLDLGTGTGRMLELLAPRADRAVGVDMSPAMLAVARARIDQSGLRNVQLRQGDLYAPPVERDSYDLVVIHQVLHFLDDPARALAEAARALQAVGPAAGGRFRRPRRRVPARALCPSPARLRRRGDRRLPRRRRPRRDRRRARRAGRRRAGQADRGAVAGARPADHRRSCRPNPTMELA